MNALLLSAGFGSRLRPITKTIPKCMVPINGKPLLGIWIDFLINSNLFKKIFINTHYLPEIVETFVNNHEHRERLVVLYEPNLLGTAGTILENINYLSNTFFVAHADNLSKFDIHEFYYVHQKKQKNIIATVMTFLADNPRECGIIEADNNIIKAFHEKVKNPPSNLANAAIYFFDKEIIEILKNINIEKPDISIDLFPYLINQAQIYQNNVYHRDIGTIRSYNQAQRDFLF